MKLLLVIVFSFFSILGWTKEQVKLSVLVPEGTTWGQTLKKFSKEVETATQGEVTFKIYFGGVSGDEPDVLRKIRIGQLQGGIFTGKTLGEIYGDVRGMEIPFTFYDNQKKASETLKKLAPKLNAGLQTRGFINLGFYEVGQVYVVTTKKVSTLNELKGIKIWSWEGDPLVGALIDSLGLVSVPLAIPDVLSSLSTGIISAAYAPPLGILALQWHTKIKYLVDFPTAFSIGALLVSDRLWKKISPAHQKIILSLSEKYVGEANTKSIVESQTAKEELKKSGIEFISFPPEDYKRAASVRSLVLDKVRKKYISNEMIGEIDREASK